MAIDKTDAAKEIDNAENVPGLVAHVKRKFTSAEDGKNEDESRWLKAYKNYRGIFDSTTQFRSSEKSKVFVKITKVKVLSAYGQIADILFANSKFPLSVESTPVPEGVAKFAHLQTPQSPPPTPPTPDPYGFEGDGKILEPGAMEATEPNSFLGGMAGKFAGANLQEGAAKMGEPQISPAQETARKMEKMIHDQLLDTSAVNVLRHSIFECALLGTGIIKGPFNYKKTVHKWMGTGEEKLYEPYDKEVPKIEAVSCWDFFPDPAATNIDDCEYVIQRHRLNREQLRDLINRPYFDSDAILKALEIGPNYEEKYYEQTIHGVNDPTYVDNRYEVYEYWGNCDASLCEEIGMSIPQGMTDLKSVQVNVWVCGNEVIRAVMNPFTPSRIPYQAFPYELNPYQFFGVGVAENMEDAQLLMNGHIRMAIDNLALAGNLVFDIDETQLVPGQSMDIFPGKIFRRQSGVTGTAVNGIKFPNTAGENVQMYDKARQLADEETGIPSVVHGQTGVTGTGRTAAGLSMIMSSAGLSIKTVIKNIDDYLLKPLGEAFFQWNMQFGTSPNIIGDLEIKPKGTSAVMQKEVRTQRLTTLLQTVSNPMLAPFVKIPNLMRELAIAQDIDPESLVNDMNEAAIFADMLRGLANVQGTGPEAQPTGEQQTGMEGTGGLPAGANQPNVSGLGNGQIGVGNVPQSGETGFTGTPQEPEGIV
jgi:hypothetical protein